MVLVLAAVLLFAGRLPALETLAYRFVGEPECEKQLAQYPAVERAPDATPFVSAGDALRDLTPSIRATKVPLKDGWVLWNATRRLLIIRGAMTDQWRISTRLGFYRQPLNCQVNVEWLRTADANHPPADTDAPFASVAVLTPSGRNGTGSTTIEAPDGEWKFEVDAGVNDTDYGVLNVRLVAENTQHGDRDSKGFGSVNCCLLLLDGKPKVAASWYVAGKGDAWWLRVTATCLLADGLRWREARLRQIGGTFEVWPTATLAEPDGTLPKCDGGFVGSMTLPEDAIEFLLNGEVPELGPDPFAEEGKNEQPFLAPDVAQNAKIPDWLSEIAAPPLTDLRQLGEKHGSIALDGCVVALEPESHRVVFAGKDKDTFKSACDLLYGVDDTSLTRNNEYESRLVAADDPEKILAQASVTSSPGTKSMISQTVGKDERPVVLLEGEFCYNEDSREITADTASELDLRTADGTGFVWKDQSHTKLSAGTQLQTEALRLPDGRRILRNQTARVVPPMVP